MATSASRVSRLVSSGLRATERRGALYRLGPLMLDVAAYARDGLRVLDWRPARAAEIAASDSSWAKRPGGGRHRPVWLLRAVSSR